MSRYLAGSLNIGLEVEKEFDGKTYKGWVTKYFKREDLYHIKYEDDDEEDVDPDELQNIVTQKPSQTEHPAGQDHGASGSVSVFDEPRRRTRASGAVNAAGGSPSQPNPKPKPNVNTTKGAAVPLDSVPRPDPDGTSSPASPDTAAAHTLFTMSSVPEEATPPPSSRAGTPFCSPKRKQKTASTAELHSPAGPGASKRAAASAPEPQPSAKKKAPSAKPSAIVSQAGPSQAAEAEAVTGGEPMPEAEPEAAAAENPAAEAGPAAEAETVAEAEPEAEVAPMAEAAPTAKAAPVAADGAGASDPEAPEEAAEAPTAVLRQPRRADLKRENFRSSGRDAVEELYKDVDILRSRPGNGGRPGPPRFSMVVYSRGFLFLAGQIVDDTSAPGMNTYYGQAKQVLHQVEQLLEESGSCMKRVLQVAVHLRDIDEGADEFNKAWLEVMDARHLPARTTVQAHLMRPDLLVEVTATAAVWS